MASDGNVTITINRPEDVFKLGADPETMVAIDRAHAAIREAIREAISMGSKGAVFDMSAIRPRGAPITVVTTPRQPGKSRLNSMWNDFLNTPGYSTREADKYGSHDEYMRIVFNKELTNKGAPMAATEEDIEELDTSPESLATVLTSHMQAIPGTFMLAEPMTLTIKKPTGQYSKRPHIGSEEFAPVRVYVGKRGALLHVFRPIAAADYVEMELPEVDAMKVLTGYKAYLEEAIEGGYSNVAKAAKRAAADAAERAKMERNADQYKDLGFGSW